jgi:hypothetical protein
MLPPSWPQRIPEVEINAIPLELPAGDGQALVEARCTTCHDLTSIVVKRTALPEWAHIIERMRGAMAIAGIPDISKDQAYGANSRLPRVSAPARP